MKHGILKASPVAAITIGVLLLLSKPVHAADSGSIEFGTGNRTQVVRVGSQWRWDQRWWESNGTHIGGYWDATLMVWHGSRYQNVPDATQNLGGIGITPVFRLQRDSLKGPYAEAAIGAHLLSDIYDNNGRTFSTRFQFGDHLSVGYVFNNGVDLSLKAQHFSNGAIKRPNPGVNFLLLRASYPF
ncbi:acyloxyacyl hydrolase [Noviherbaspirillum galbum]|uniref:Lipid A deacylase n=1 Tax=Noviherbaspirillum galbum TaxID=2709383 RepID=A0A6B3SK17_9BURK|nr:acyloxyacyl hydrolase [Noviherbaspirillum galbum]NEX61117.1 acyloxyacyl hydrolase [Noviherbaspirillum galbum]